MVVSYKKQVILGILLLVILFGVVEVLVNIWLYNFYKCDFEDNELFKDTDKKSLRTICLENIGLASAEDNLTWIEGTRPNKGLNDDIVYINSQGFRSPEFTQEKPENTIRIFVLGGSTAFGVGVLDHQTFPSQLQKLFDTADLGFNVEVINAGWPGKESLSETNLINSRLLAFSPDLFLVYDGWNDLTQYAENNTNSTPEKWFDRWKGICKQGKTYGYDTIITIQPLLATAKKNLTPQEEKIKIYWLKNHPAGKAYPSYQLFLEKLNELKNYCSLTADMTGIFDGLEGPIYFDTGHTGFIGNKIIAETFFDISLPIVMEKAKQVDAKEIDLDQRINFTNAHDANPSDNYSNELYSSLKNLISPYKTPKALQLIFEN